MPDSIEDSSDCPHQTSDVSHAMLCRSGRSLFFSGFSGNAYIARDGRFVAANGPFCAMLGYSQTDLVRRRIQDVTKAEFMLADEDQMERVARGDIRSYDLNKVFVHHDGTLVHVFQRMDAVRGSDGDFICLLVQTSLNQDAQCSYRASANTASVLRLLVFLRVNWPWIAFILTGISAFLGHFWLTESKPK